MNGGSRDRGRRVLWLTADKPETISVGRRRIAEHLGDAGYRVTLRGTTARTVREAFRNRNAYDLVVGTTRAGAIAGTALKLRAGLPLVVDHVDPIRQFAASEPWPLAFGVRHLENLAFSVADHVLYVYDEEERRVRQHARAATQTALGVEYDRFASPDPAIVEAARTRLRALDVRDDVVIYVGGLEPVYRVTELLDATAHLEDWTLVVLGAGSLASAVAERAAVDGSVAYLGTVPHEEVPGYLHAADVGVCLVDDPHTLKVLEYLAAGLPVVQQRGRAERRFGDLLAYADPTPSSIAGTIERVGRTGDAADRRAFARRYDWRAISETYREVIERVTGARRTVEEWEPTTSSS